MDRESEGETEFVLKAVFHFFISKNKSAEWKIRSAWWNSENF